MNTDIPEEKWAEIKAALSAGLKIEAITLYRECTGTGLAEAKEAVDKLEKEVRAAVRSTAISEEKWTEIQAALFAGRKLWAIKLYRECSGTGLAEAKDAVEKLENELRDASPEKFTAPAESKGCLGAAALFCAIAGAAFWVVRFPG